MKLCYKIWLDNNGKSFGWGPYQLLVNVEQYGSLREAACVMKMSYSKAWKTINMIENKMGFAFLHRVTGGLDGGGATLTEEGKLFLEKYQGFIEETDQALVRLFEKYFQIEK